MKQEIEKEAKGASIKHYALTICSDSFYKSFQEGFISGVNSKCAERIKIEYAIGILHELLEEIPVGSKESKIISNKFNELQNQLKDEN